MWRFYLKKRSHTNKQATPSKEVPGKIVGCAESDGWPVVCGDSMNTPKGKARRNNSNGLDKLAADKDKAELEARLAEGS